MKITWNEKGQKLTGDNKQYTTGLFRDNENAGQHYTVTNQTNFRMLPKMK